MKNLIQLLPKISKISLGILGALFLGIAPVSAIDVGVSPPRFHIDINSKKTRSQAIKVMNFDSKPVELKVYVRSWTMNENNQLQAVPPTEQSLDQWIVYTPSRFTIPPGGSQTIRFAVRPRLQPKNGEHRAVVFIEEILPPNSSPKPGVQITGRLGVAVYGYVGDIKRVGVLNAVNVETKPNALNAVFDISNQGNGYVSMKGQYAIWPAAKYPGAEATKPIPNFTRDTKINEPLADAGLLPSIPVLPDNRRQVLLPITKKLPPGDYVLDINGELNGVAIKKGIPFTVPFNAPVAENRPPRTPSGSQNLRNNLRNTPRRN